MVAKISNSGFIFKSVLLGASMLTFGSIAAAQAASPTPAPIAAPPAIAAPAPVQASPQTKAEAPKTDKMAKVAEQHRLSAATEAAFEKIKGATVAAKDGVTKDGKALLSAVDDEIAATKKKFDGATAEAKSQWAKQEVALKALRDKLATQVDGLGAAKAEGWDAARKGVEGAYHDFSNAVAAALGKLKA